MVIIAHRGESRVAPENSMTAIQMAWNKGAKAVEIDVHLTVDNNIVVIHDKHTGRTGDKKLVIATTYAEDLKNIDIGAKKAPEYYGEKIPALRDVLKTIPEYGKLIIEIKCGKTIVPFLSRILTESGLDDNQIEIISFNLDTIRSARKAMPQYKMLWLLSLDYYLPYWLIPFYYRIIIMKVKANRIDGVNLRAGAIINKKIVDIFIKHNLIVYVWTVNKPNIASRLISWGVDGITTDRAHWLTQQLIEQNV